jgi:hypothetical protein
MSVQPVIPSNTTWGIPNTGNPGTGGTIQSNGGTSSTSSANTSTPVDAFSSSQPFGPPMGDVDNGFL